jgi:amino acid adenylation domain-containing protein
MQNTEVIVEQFELSPQQRHVWSLPQTGPRTPYVVQGLAQITGPLKPELLRATLHDAVERHTILRTAFKLDPETDRPLQTLNDDAACVIAEHDLAGLAAHEQTARLAELLTTARQATLDLARGGLLQVALLQLGAERHALLLTLPALCADRATLAHLLRDISRSYEARGRGAELTDEPMQYVDLVEWQNELLTSEETEPGRAYWRAQSLAVLAALKLPAEQTPAGASGFSPQVFTAPFAQDVSARLATLAAAYSTSESVVLLTCWLTLLWRLTGQPEVFVGAAYDGRKYEELQAVLGPLAKYLPVGARVSEQTRFDELLAQVAQAAGEAHKWQESFSWETATGVAEAANALMPYCFEYVTAPAPYVAGDVSFALQGQYECAEHFKVKLACTQTPAGLHAEFYYDEGLFSVASIARLAEELQTLLASAADAPTARLTELNFVGAAERQLLLADFNATQADFALDVCLPQLIEAQVARTPEQIAAVFEAQHLTYAELNARANQLAGYLRYFGVGPDVPVGVLMERSLEMLVALLAVLKAGGAYVPLDPEYPQERLAFMLAEFDSPVLLTQQRLLSVLPAHAAQVLCLDTQWDAVTNFSTENPSVTTTPDNLAYIIYTSGSTGKPKGAMLAHRGIVNRLLWMQAAYKLTAQDRVLQKTPFSFDVSVWEFFWPLLTGARLVFARPGGHRDAAYLADLIAMQQISVLHFVPAMLHAFLRAPELELCSCLRLVVCSGEALPFELQERFFASFAATELHNLYGPTEASVDVTAWACVRGATSKSVPIGRPVANTQIYLLDEQQRFVPLGAAGELCIGGVSLARGYLQRPDLTAERFIPDPFSTAPGARLYRTGDLARYLPDGAIEYLGRLDHQVKVRGFRIELGEIEAVLAAHPTVGKVVVVVREDEADDKRLVAYIVPARGSALAAEELRSFLDAKLPEYMIPAAFVALDALPLSPNGKVDRRALPQPDAVRQEEARTYVAPRDGLERALAQIWEEILNVRPIGVFDNFFRLGGHSILAVRVIAQVQQHFGRELPLAALIQNATIDHLAGLIRQETRTLPWDALVAIQPEGTKPPFFAVHSIGGQVFCYVAVARHLGQDQPFYGLQAPRLEALDTEYISIEEMAAHYLHTVRGVQPEGPYYLGGYSFGGMVAFEMARQLQAQGQEVAMLAIIDSRSPTDINKLPAYEDDDALMLTLRAKVQASERGRKIDISRAEFDGLDYEQQLAHFLHRLQSEGLLPPEHDIEFTRKFMNGYKARQKSMRFYVPQVYDGRVTIFRATEQDPWLVKLFEQSGVDMNDPTLGWGQLSSESVEVYDVPGGHEQIVYEPHVRVLAKRLREAIAKAASTQPDATTQTPAPEAVNPQSRLNRFKKLLRVE